MAFLPEGRELLPAAGWEEGPPGGTVLRAGCEPGRRALGCCPRACLLLLHCKESWDDLLSTGVTKVAEGLFKEIGVLCISKGIYIHAGQNPVRGRGNGRRHCAVPKPCGSVEGGDEAC